MLSYDKKPKTRSEQHNEFIRKREAEGWKRVTLLLPPDTQAAIVNLASRAGVRPWKLVDELIKQEASRAADGGSPCPR